MWQHGRFFVLWSDNTNAIGMAFIKFPFIIPAYPRGAQSNIQRTLQ